jgi:hypothetical protein
VRGGAHGRMTGQSPDARTGRGWRLGASASVTEDAAPRLDDLMHEVSGRGMFGARATLIGWGFCGFLIGALFWHAIGFWDVIGEEILQRPEAKVSIVARLALPARPSNCTTLVLDRSTGRTISVPCAEQMPHLEEASVGRSDLTVAEARIGDAVR